MTRNTLTLAVLLAAAFLQQGCAPLAVTAAAGGAMMASDRRPPGIYIEDENIEWRVFARLREGFQDSHVNATSYNRRVLLTGEAPTAEMKKQVEDAVRGL